MQKNLLSKCFKLIRPATYSIKNEMITRKIRNDRIIAISFLKS